MLGRGSAASIVETPEACRRCTADQSAIMSRQEGPLPVGSISCLYSVCKQAIVPESVGVAYLYQQRARFGSLELWHRSMAKVVCHVGVAGAAASVGSTWVCN